MPPRGKKPKPTQLKVLQGTDRPDRVNSHEPKPDLSIPVPGDHLSLEAVMEWGRITPELKKLGLITEIDHAALEAYCETYGRWVILCRLMKEPDFKWIEKTSKGTPIQNPVVGMANTCLSLMHKFLVEFGMTPSSRTRVSVPPQQNDENPFAALGS